MKRGRIEKAQALLNHAQRRLEVLQEQLNGIGRRYGSDDGNHGDDDDSAHAQFEMMWIRKNNELQIKARARKARNAAQHTHARNATHAARCLVAEASLCIASVYFARFVARSVWSPLLPPSP